MDVRIKDKYWLIEGDCVTAMKKIPDEKCDSLITDPPAGISFMGKKWDDDKGGRDDWIKWLSDIMSEAMRCLKPGAHGLVWAIPRTSHWTTMALENAGFEIRDVITHLFGTGFPKSHNISKSIDKEFGAEREVIGTKLKNTATHYYENGSVQGSANFGVKQGDSKVQYINKEIPITLPSELSKQFDGWGTALKPASEHWILIRKPLSEKTVAKNVLKFGTGGINIDACRIGLIEGEKTGRTPVECPNSWKNTSEKTGSMDDKWKQGRFPANLVLSHNDDCEFIGTKEIGSGENKISWHNPSKNIAMSGGNLGHNSMYYGKETVSDYKCSEGCAVKALDEQSGYLHGAGNKTPKEGLKDKGIFGQGVARPSRTLNICDMQGGGASRFFYCAKASGADKNTGLDDFEPKKVNDGRQTEIDNAFQRGETKRKNTHPTVKSTKLMEYLIKLITPENGVVLDPFMGSGTTGVSARNLNKKFIGIEKESEYFTIAKSRLEYTNNDSEQWEPIQKVS